MRKYTVEQFKEKYSGKNRISCGINYEDGRHDTIMCASFSQIMRHIKNKNVAFIAAK